MDPESYSSTMIQCLPNDVILHMFSYLDAVSLCKVRRVCRIWNDLATDEILWKQKLLSDVNTWKQVTSTGIPEVYLQATSETAPHEAYINSCPEIKKWKRNMYETTTLHQLTYLLRTLMPTKKYQFGLGVSSMDELGEGQSFFSKLMSTNAANVFQHCGEFPGRFRGHGGGFQFRYRKSMLDLCLLYVEDDIVATMSDEGFTMLLASIGGYIHTVDVGIQEGMTGQQTLENLSVQSEELRLYDKKLKPGVPILILSIRKVESDPYISSYAVSQALQLKSLDRPWMVSECSAQMLYRDIVDAMDWLISVSKTS